MQTEDRLTKICERHEELEAAIRKERKQHAPNELLINNLKRQKLRLTDIRLTDIRLTDNRYQIDR